MTNDIVRKADGPNWIVNILSFCCIPLLGIILFFVWKDQQPTAAKWALWSGLASIGVGIIIYAIFFIFSIALGLA